MIEEMSYGEILANLAMNGEVIITIPTEQEEAVRIGLRNLKARQALKLEKEGLPKPEEVLQFSATQSSEYEDCVDLHIILKKKGVIEVRKMVIPDNTF